MGLRPLTIYLPNKFASDRLDYQVDFTAYIPRTFQLDSADVEVIDSGTGESPLELEVLGDPTVQTDREGKASVMGFWLQGGSPKTRYRLVLTGSDNQHGEGDPDRSYSVYAEVYVTGP